MGTFSSRIHTLFLVLLLMALPAGCTKKQVVYPSSASSGLSRQQQVIQKALAAYYQEWKGTPYREGGMSREAVDCSAFTLFAYRDLFSLDLPRTVQEQAGQGKSVARESLQPGDLVFFKTGLWQRHVGIYLQHDMFIHASSSQGVYLSKLDNTYWRNRYWKATRLLPM